jgi:thiamine transporter ThiT
MIRFIKSDQLIVRQAALWAGFYIAVSLRLFFHIISGVVLYEVDWVGSWTYNVSYLFPSYVLSAIVLSALIEIKSIQSILFSNQ